jgi:hypothetical protein
VDILISEPSLPTLCAKKQTSIPLSNRLVFNSFNHPLSANFLCKKRWLYSQASLYSCTIQYDMKRILLAVMLLSGLTSEAQLIDETFADGNFTSGPVWTGNNNANWAVEADGIGGPDAIGSNTLRLQPFSIGPSYLSTPNSSWGTFQGWGLWWGRQRPIDLDNQQYFWLFSNRADVLAPDVDGYRLALIPDPFDPDILTVIQLQRVVDGAVDEIIAEQFINGGVSDYGFVIRVTRNASDQWAMFTNFDVSAETVDGWGEPATTSPYAAAGGIIQTGQETSGQIPITGTGYLAVQTNSTKDIVTGNSGDAEFDRIMFVANGSLPVDLERFGAMLSNGSINLNWQVGTENNVKGYEVERSATGTRFEKIGFVGATGSRSYSFADRQPLEGKSLYRLKTVDLDGTYSYSQIVGVNIDLPTGIKLFPNPATDRVFVQHNPAVTGSTMRVIGSSGQVIKYIALAQNQVQTSIDLSGIPTGLYMVVFDNATEGRLVYRFLKK